jgi:hypothetical protein
MPQRASVFCNFYIRVDREALFSERALDVGSVAFKAMSTKMHFIIYKDSKTFKTDKSITSGGWWFSGTRYWLTITFF